MSEEYGTLESQEHAFNSQDVIDRRNNMLLAVFSYHLNMDVELVGNPNHPMMFYKKNVAMALHVKNFEISIKKDFWTMKPGSDLYSFKLMKGPRHDKTVIMEALKESIHERVSRIQLKGTKLCLSGYNFKNRRNETGRYPVFSRYRIKHYPSITYAEDITILLMRAGYNVELIDDAEPDEIISNIKPHQGEQKEIPEDYNLI